MSDSDEDTLPGASGDDDVTIPRAAMNKMIKEAAPGNYLICLY